MAAPLRALTGVSDLGKCAATAVNLETAAELAVAGFEKIPMLMTGQPSPPNLPPRRNKDPERGVIGWLAIDMGKYGLIFFGDEILPI